MCVCWASDFDAFHSFVDALQQSLVLWTLEAVLVGVHVGQCAYVAVKVLLSDRFLLWYKQQPISAEESSQEELCSDDITKYTTKQIHYNNSTGTLYVSKSPDVCI